MANRFTSLAHEDAGKIIYPEVSDILTDDDIEISDRILRDNSAADLYEFCKRNETILHLGERAFKTLVHVPENFNGNVVVVPTGLMADINPGSVTQARIVREIADPDAALLVQAHASLGSTINNFSAHESRKLYGGDLEPLLDRLNVGLDSIDGAVQAAYSGASLGAATTSAALARANSMIVPSVAGTMIEPAHVVDRSLAALGYDYARSMGDMGDVFDLVAPEGMTGEEMLDKFKVKAPMLGIRALAENVALTGILKQNRLARDLKAVPAGVGLFHAWSAGSDISSDSANQAVAEMMKDNPNYESMALNNPNTKHGLTVAYPIHGAIARHAISLAGVK